MEGAINSPQEDEEEAGDDVGVVVGVYGCADSEGCGYGLLPDEAEDFADQGGGGDDAGDVDEGAGFWLCH